MGPFSVGLLHRFGLVTEEVTVQYSPYWHYGLAGKSSKKDTKAAFLEFIDWNSQPNGRKAESPYAISYLCYLLP